MTQQLPFPPEQIVAALHASPARRYLAVGVTVTLGLFMINLGFAGRMGLGGQLFLVALGALVLWQAARLWTASQGAIYLTRAGLYDQDGQCLAEMAHVVSVSRGPFAFKPSGGFSLLLDRRYPRAAVPGMWWRFGRRLGIGGVTGQGAARFMAETIDLQLAER